MTPLFSRFATLTDDFPPQTLLAFAGAALVGACAAEEESYVMLWPALPGPYEPLLVLDWTVLALAVTADGRRLVLAGRGAKAETAGFLHVTLLDLERSRRADLVTAGDRLALGTLDPIVTWSADGRLAAVSGVESSGEQLTLLFEADATPMRRWMVTGLGTRWHDGRLVLLEPHGVGTWGPEDGLFFEGDAPPKRSPGGRWALTIDPRGLLLTGDGVERVIPVDESHLEPVAWVKDEAVVLGYDAPFWLELATGELSPLVPEGHRFLALDHTGTTLVVENGDALLLSRLALNS